MSEALIGVLVGGLIASIAPIASLLLEHRRWSREKRLEHLRKERDRLEMLFREALADLSRAMEQNSYPIQMLADMNVLMPRSVMQRFNEWMEKSDKTDQDRKEAFLEISIEMKSALAELDRKIETAINA